MASEAIAFHLIEDILERFLPDFPYATGGKFPATALLLDVASVLQNLHQFFELLYGLIFIVPEKFLDHLTINGVNVIQATRFLKLLFKTLHLLHTTHHTDSLVQGQRFAATKRETGARLLHGCNSLEILSQFHQIDANTIITHQLIHEVLQLLPLFG